MKKKTARKLRLCRETLHNLNDPVLRPVVGGVISEVSNCPRCQTIEPCLDTGTCPLETIDGCGGTIPTLNCAPTAQTVCQIC